MLSSDQSTFAMLIAMSVSDTFNGANPSLARSWLISFDEREGRDHVVDAGRVAPSGRVLDAGQVEVLSLSVGYLDRVGRVPVAGSRRRRPAEFRLRLVGDLLQRRSASAFACSAACRFAVAFAEASDAALSAARCAWSAFCWGGGGIGCGPSSPLRASRLGRKDLHHQL